MNSVPKDYGYVLLAATASWGTCMWMAKNVADGRKKYGVPYPRMYSDTEDTFNCIQRAHQNTLEFYPSFLFFLSTAGLERPRFAASCGLLWCLGRVVYAKGYYSGKPEKRNYGGFGNIGYLGLIGCTVALAAKKLELY
uniref:microsomal glutathione S-transferase 3-like n=1 Tax=Styela clava TaxID=7725 RepID=UPI0019394A13|nr:microsomal glutathione S-transferase 3-like [Styela clava]